MVSDLIRGHEPNMELDGGGKMPVFLDQMQVTTINHQVNWKHMRQPRTYWHQEYKATGPTQKISSSMDNKIKLQSDTILPVTVKPRLASVSAAHLPSGWFNICPEVP